MDTLELDAEVAAASQTRFEVCEVPVRVIQGDALESTHSSRGSTPWFSSTPRKNSISRVCPCSSRCASSAQGL
jgi:hypothetical protein